MLHGKRILKRHEGYANLKTRKKGHWTDHWNKRTLYKESCIFS